MKNTFRNVMAYVPLRLLSVFAFTAFLLLISSNASFAVDVQRDVTGIAKNIVKNTNQLPGIISAIAYLVGLFFGVTGILKLKSHIDQPSQNPLRGAIARLLIGGALFSLPFIYVVMQHLIVGDGRLSFDDKVFSPLNSISGLLGMFSGLAGDIGITRDFNAILSTIVDSLKGVPAFIAALAYLLALVMGLQGLLKLKEHIENPDQSPLKEAVVRFVIGGAFFAIPAIYAAMMEAFTGGSSNIGATGIVNGILDAVSGLTSPYDSKSCAADMLAGTADSVTFGLFNFSGDSTLGSVMCMLVAHTGALPAFFGAFAYLFGLVLGFTGLLKIRDHALNPQNTPLSQGISRFAAGGAFFALPIIVETMRATVTPASSTATEVLGFFGIGDTATISGYNVAGNPCNVSGLLGQLGDFASAAFDKLASWFGGGGGDAAAAAANAPSAMGLDTRLYCAVTDVLGPLHGVLNFFTFTAGTLLIMIGISRLLKSEQDGPRGPGGIGTIMTFFIGGSLLAFDDFVRLTTVTLFSTSQTATHAAIQYAGDPAELVHAHMFISAIIKFLIMVGLISFVRGLFIIRGVAEGNNQSSLMAGLTHVIGGTLAVNIGPLMNVVQATLGITGYGIVFS